MMNRPVFKKRLFLISIAWRFVCVVLISLVFSLFGSMQFNNHTAAQGPCGDTYIVLSGDTIEDIANLCSTTVEAILKINPEISDPENLYPGQIIRIPKVEPFLETIVAIAPTCGLPGSSLLVVGSGFPLDTYVQLSFSQKDKDPFFFSSRRRHTR